ncbi:MAG: aldo/keto reductase [Christensenellaceae bacterium]|nr:aldo/keto reductase [Christensenellaceae bacterium]
METTVFGKTGRLVSRIGFGGAVAGLKNYLHEYDPASSEAKAGVHEALEAALEHGISYFDTAPGYGNGASETLFGDVLGGVEPERIFLATKCSAFSNEGGVSDYDHVLRSAEQSLKRLRRDFVDLLQLHGGSYTDAQTERVMGEKGALEALEKLKKDGVVRHIGFTTEDNNRAMYEFFRSGRFDSVQLCYNFLFQHPYEPSRPFGSLYEAEKKGLGIAAMRATTSGTFQRWMRAVRPGDNFDYTSALIQFVLSNPLVDVVLIGMRSKERVLQNVAIMDDASGRVDLSLIHERYV